MKKILLLTDLSQDANHVTDAAIMLSAKLNTNLIFFNAFINQPSLAEYGGNPWYTQEILWENEAKERLVVLKDDALARIEGLAPGEHRASINCRQGIGPLGTQAKSLLDSEHIELIVMGARSGSTMDHLLMGSDTVSVINDTSRPVVIVPASHPLKQLKKITVAVNFDDADLNAVHYLTRIGRLFDFTIDIVHVKLWGEADSDRAEHSEFEKHVAKYNYPGISYHYIGGKDLVNRLQDLCKTTGSDLLVLVHDEHSFMNKLLHKSHAKSLVQKQEVPVMIIPAGLEID